MFDKGSGGQIRDQYEAIVETISEAAYLLDTDRNLAYTNQSSLSHPDVSLETFRGGHILDLIERIVADDEDPERFEQALETVYDESANVELPVTVALDIDASTGTTTREYRCSPCETESATGALVVSRAVTEHRERNLEQYEQLFETLPVAAGINTLGKEGQFEFVNQTAIDMFDASSKAELTQHSLRDLYADPDEREQFSERLKESGTVEQYETEFTTLDGECLWVSITAELTEIDGEKRAVGVMEDISVRKQNEQQMREEKAFADGILDSLSDVFYGFDAEANLVEYNERLCSVTGYNHDELAAMAPWEFFPEEERDKIADAVSQVVQSGEPVHSIEGHLLTKSGAEIPYGFSGAPFYDSNGSVAGFVGFGRDISDRKERERRLQEKRERLQGLFDEAPDPIFIQDGSGRFVDANEKAVEKLGYSRDELLQMEAADIDANVDRDDAEELLSTARSEGRTLEIEGRHRCADGSTYPVEVRVTPLETEGPNRFLSHSRDITDRKEREQELARSEEFLEQTQEVANIGGWEVDLRTDTLRWTDAVYHIHGKPMEFDPTVEDAIQLYHPGDQETIRDAVERATTEGESYDREVRIVRPDGEVRWVRTLGEPWHEDGETVGVRGTFQDINDRKQREQELERHRNVIQAVDDGVYALDEEGHFELVNDAMSELTGYDTEELLGEHTSYIKSDAMVEQAESAVRSRIFNEPEGDEATLELEIQRDDGSEFPAEDHMTLLWDDDGERFDGTAGIIRNITERKEREQELQTTNEQLEVLNRILRHDIRNDVQVIQGWAEKLQSELPATYQDELQRILRTNENTKELTENGRELIQSFTQDELESEPVRLDGIVEGELESARSRYSDADFTVDGSLPAAVVSANGALSSVVRNLLNNAVQHNRGQVTVTVRVQQDDDAVRLLVVDNGPGVPDDKKEKIFGKGERGLESDGTGIGLYLVNQLVQSYGGDVWVEDSEQHNASGQTGSNDSGGAVFIVELPTETG